MKLDLGIILKFLPDLFLNLRIQVYGVNPFHEQIFLEVIAWLHYDVMHRTAKSKLSAT